MMSSADTGHDSEARTPEPRQGAHPSSDLIPREYLRVIAVWSLIPAYFLAGAFLGWLVDRWLGFYPYGIGVGLLVALGFAVRDMLRLRDTF
jgi:F0F1-type ATP synthase assembly protein I